MEATDAVVSAIEKFGNMKPPKYDVSIIILNPKNSRYHYSGSRIWGKFGNMKQPKCEVGIFRGSCFRVWWLGVHGVEGKMAVPSHRGTRRVLDCLVRVVGVKKG
jgi:hypothetical protein